MDDFKRIIIRAMIAAATLALLCSEIAWAEATLPKGRASDAQPASKLRIQTTCPYLTNVLPAATGVVAAATPQPTTTPTFTASKVCVLAFDDRNSDGLRDVGEDLLGGVTFTLSDVDGPMASYITDGRSEPHCFNDLQPANYQLKTRLPPTYVATTSQTLILALPAGARADVEFGARLSRKSASDERDSVVRRVTRVLSAILISFLGAPLLTSR